MKCRCSGQAPLHLVSSCFRCCVSVQGPGKGKPCRLRCLMVMLLQFQALLGVLKHCCLCRCAADSLCTLPVQCFKWLHFAFCLKRWHALRLRQVLGCLCFTLRSPLLLFGWMWTLRWGDVQACTLAQGSSWRQQS